MSSLNQQQQKNRKLIRLLVLVSVGMFGFGFAMWPLYNVFCDITGFGGRGVQVAQASSLVTGTSDREVRITFDATVNSALPWDFKPAERQMTVRLGELSNAKYLALNTSNEAIAGHAIYNVTPPEASLYFVKTECFCFTEQLLQQGEAREMPVYFFVKTDLPANITDITLSYTFFRDSSDAGLTLTP